MNIKEVKVQYRPCPLCFSDTGYYLIPVNGIDLLRCKQCSMVFADVEEALNEKHCKYEAKTILRYYNYEPAYTIAYYDMTLNTIVRWFNNANVKVLDFGCGSGMFLRRARKKGMIPFGVDFSEYSLYASSAFNLKIMNSDIFNCNFPSNYFDVIYSHATFEHLYSPIKVSQELLRILKPHGLFIISGLPNYQTLSIKLFREFTNNFPPGHVNFFELKTVRYFFRLLGLRNLRISTYGFNIWFFLQKSEELKKFLGIGRKDLDNFRNLEYSDHEIIYRLKNQERDLDRWNPGFIEKLMTNLYYKVRLPGMGSTIEAFGIKEDGQ